MNPVIVLAAASGTGLVSFRMSSFLSQRFKAMGITGIDIHKLNKPVTAEMGGVAVVVALFFGAGVLILLDGAADALFLSGVATIALAGLIGIADDHFVLRQRTKAVLVALASFPLSYYLLGGTNIVISFPFIGAVSFGILTSILIVPFALTTSANFANMLAGFNGMEAGIATIAVGTLTFLAAVRGMWEGAALGVLLLCAYVGFLALNWYPAKIFPGDTGTLMFGAGLVTIGIISNLEFAAIVLSMPAAFDFSLKMISRRPFGQRKLIGNSSVNADETLHPADYPALVHAFMRVAPTTEKSLVRWVLLMEAVYAVLAVALTFWFG